MRRPPSVPSPARCRRNLQRLDDEEEQTRQDRRAEDAALDALGGRQPELKLGLDRLNLQIQREDNRQRLLTDGHIFYLEGWVPEADTARLEQLLEGYSCAWDLRVPTEEEYPEVPVTLKSNWLTRSMTCITEQYSMPAYDGVDPNPVMAPFFILFFGMMMADMGYGLLMIFLPLLYLKKARPPESKRGFIELILWCGIVTFIFGALTGGFFGDFIPQLCKVIDPASTFELPSLFSPLNDTMAIMVGSMVLGGIQILTGMTISVVKKNQGRSLCRRLVGRDHMVDHSGRRGHGAPEGGQRGRCAGSAGHRRADAGIRLRSGQEGLRQGHGAGERRI